MAVASPFNARDQKTFDEWVAKLAAKYPPENRAAALIPVMHAAQKLLGWLSDQTLEYVAQVVGVPPIRVREVATFYSMFHLKPVGRHHVQVCTNLSCWLAGADKVYEHVRKRFGTEPFQPTADGQFSVCEVECLAACGYGPAVVINDQYYESATIEQLDRELDRRAAGKAPAQS